MKMMNMNKNKNRFIFSAIFLFGAIFSVGTTEPIKDKQILLDFIERISHSRVINWDMDSSACSNWIGITCNHDNSTVIALRLPAFSLHGSIPSNTLSRLSNLQILSLRSNELLGVFPFDFSSLRNLTALYLQSNGFYGSLPLDFSVWDSLSVLDLSNNGFNGSISPSISSLTHLTSLNLANNSLSGEIPNLDIPSLQILDLSNNNLTGNLPRSHVKFPSSGFLGNNLIQESSSLPAFSPKPSKKSSKLRTPAILGIVIGGFTFALVSVLALLMIRRCLKKDGQNEVSETSKNEKGTKELRSRSEHGLVFFEGSRLAFDLEDLFRASAEVLGKGTFGTTYKAVLEDAGAVVVKRLTEVSVTRREFEQHMEIVGGIRHENVVPLRAYYYSKDEKLMVYDYFNQGSVSSFLHAKRGEKRSPLDWDSRLRIAIGAARGIAHIHGGKLVHGNIKASNTFINRHHYGCVSDLGPATVSSPVAAPGTRAGGYRAPEIIETGKVFYQASDVYSFGVLLLELLSGKSPTGGGGDEVVDLVRWVQSVVREEWTAEVFDVELLRYPNIEEEMVEMLQIGMQCVAKSPEQRPKMAEVVNLVENIRTTRTITGASEGSMVTLTPTGSPWD